MIHSFPCLPDSTPLGPRAIFSDGCFLLMFPGTTALQSLYLPLEFLADSRVFVTRFRNVQYLTYLTFDLRVRVRIGQIYLFRALPLYQWTLQL